MVEVSDRIALCTNAGCKEPRFVEPPIVVVPEEILFFRAVPVFLVSIHGEAGDVTMVAKF